MKNPGRIIIAVIILVVLGYIAWFFSSIIAYILISAVLSFIGQPLVKIFDKIKILKFKMPHAISSLLALVSMIFIFFMIGRIFIPLIADQASSLSDVNVEALSENLEEPMQKLQITLMKYGVIEDDLESTISTGVMKVVNVIDFDAIFSSLFDLAGTLFIGVFSVLFLTFFFLKDERLFFNGIMVFVPTKYEEDAKVILSESKRLLSRYFIGILLEVIIMATLETTGGIILGLENALLIGVLGGMFNVIPYLGPVIGATVGAILVMATNLSPDFVHDTLPLMLGIVGVFAIANLIDNFVLQPLIYSTSVKSHPIEIFIVIIMAGSLAGIPGMILAIPTYTLFRIIARQFFNRFKFVKKITERM